MNDQERITDFLNSEKKMSLNYGIFASECVSVPLRDEFLKLINQSHQTQTQLFTTAQSRAGTAPNRRPRIRLAKLTPSIQTNSPPYKEAEGGTRHGPSLLQIDQKNPAKKD